MPERMYVHKVHPRFLAEPLKKIVGLPHSHRGAVGLREQPVTFDPLAAEFTFAAILSFLKCFQLLHQFIRQLQHALTAFRFRGICIDALFFCVFKSTHHAEHIVFPVDVLPFQSQQLTAAQSRERRQREEDRIFVIGLGFLLEQFQHLLDFL